MSTFNTTQTRRFFVIPAFAALAVFAQASQAADRAGDIQTQVASVVAGARSESSTVQGVGSVSHRVDFQESTRRLLAGERNFGINVDTQASAAAVGSPVGSNGQSSNEVQKLTQAVVLGRAAS